MPRGRPRKNQDVLFRSAEWVGWALGGLEREILQTPGAGPRRGGRIAGRRRRAVGRRADRPSGKTPPPHVTGSAEAHFGHDEKALGGTAEEERVDQRTNPRPRPRAAARR